MKKFVFMMISTMFICACSPKFAGTGENRYLSSKNAEPLVIPAPLTRENLSTFYVLPNS